MHSTKTHTNSVEANQTWWEMVAIQGAGWMGIPTLASSILILQRNSFLGAVLTVIVGNAVLWFIRFSIISMSYKNRQSTLDLSESYMGKIGGYLVSVLLLTSTLCWYVAQTSIGGEALSHLLSVHESEEIDKFSQMSVLIGVLSTVFCMQGMALLKKLSLFLFPVLMSTFLIALFNVKEFNYNNFSQGISLSGLSIFLSTNLGITSDLPTFFRHSKNWGNSVKALTWMQITSIIFGILFLFLWAVITDGFNINEKFILESNALFRYSIVIFILCSVICANVANVYSASVGWELIAPNAFVGKKEYLILGLSLSVMFVLISGLFSTDYLLYASDAMLVNLCLVLCLGFIISNKTKAPPNKSQQQTYLIAWVLASIVNISMLRHSTTLSSLVISLIVIALTVASSQKLRRSY